MGAGLRSGDHVVESVAVGSQSEGTAGNAHQVSGLPRVTVIDDNREFLAIIDDILTSDRFVVTLIEHGHHGVLERARRSNPDVLMIELRFGVDRLRGWHLAQALRRDCGQPRLPVIACSADYQALDALADQTATDTRVAMIRKPLVLDQLSDAIDRLVGREAPVRAADGARSAHVPHASQRDFGTPSSAPLGFQDPEFGT
jgi:CheY-like chemotaxis protein